MLTPLDQGRQDTDLVAAARKGDREAFGILASRYRSVVVGLCTRAFGDPDLGQDAAQEAIVAALLSLDHLR